VDSKLYIGNLSHTATENDLRELFGQAGEIKEITLITDRMTRQPKGFGFVEMTNQSDAEKAIQMFNDQELDGQRLIVNIARPREDRGRSNSRREAGERSR
jgi:cold-inducible RNA-binding protein